MNCGFGVWEAGPCGCVSAAVSFCVCTKGVGVFLRPCVGIGDVICLCGV